MNGPACCLCQRRHLSVIAFGESLKTRLILAALTSQSHYHYHISTIVLCDFPPFRYGEENMFARFFFRAKDH